MVDWLLVVAWCLLNIRPHFTRTTKKRKSAIGSIEYTIKKEIVTVKSRIKKAEFHFKADENQVCNIHITAKVGLKVILTH
jgi:hypothetical protein